MEYDRVLFTRHRELTLGSSLSARYDLLENLNVTAAEAVKKGPPRNAERQRAEEQAFADKRPAPKPSRRNSR